MKKEYIRVRLNEIEKKVLIENSKKAKMTMSDYIRFCCIIIPYEKIEAKLQIYFFFLYFFYFIKQ